MKALLRQQVRQAEGRDVKTSPNLHDVINELSLSALCLEKRRVCVYCYERGLGMGNLKMNLVRLSKFR